MEKVLGFLKAERQKKSRALFLEKPSEVAFWPKSRPPFLRVVGFFFGCSAFWKLVARFTALEVGKSHLQGYICTSFFLMKDICTA